MLFYGVLCGAAPDFIWMVILRFLTGAGVAAMGPAITYYLEFLSCEVRGRAAYLMVICISFGGAYAAILGLVLLHTAGWHWWLSACALPNVVFLIISIWLPESPKYYLACGDIAKAKESIKFVAQFNNVKLEEFELVKHSKHKRGQIHELFHVPYLYLTLVIICAWISTSFIYYGIILVATQLIEYDSNCPENIQTVYQTHCNSELSTGNLVKILFGSFCEVPGIIICLFLIDSLGRKPVMFITNGVFMLSCLLLLICMDSFPMTVLLYIGRSSGTNALQVPYLYTPEVYPSEIRAIASGVGVCFGCISAFVTPYVAQVLMLVSVKSGLCVYAVFGLFGMVLALLFPVETKGRNLVEY